MPRSGLLAKVKDGITSGHDQVVVQRIDSLAVASRIVRRSLKEGPRLQAERKGEMDLRFAAESRTDGSQGQTVQSFRREISRDLMM